nr:carboxypeptidase-like regulatory domain-containing protein [Aquimarina agarivorans]
MRHKLLLLVFFCCGFSFLTAQQFTLSGTIKDQKNGETLYGVNIILNGTDRGTVTNEYGFYSITAPQNDYTVSISYLGYKSTEKQVNLNENTKLNLELEEETVALNEVVVSNNKTNVRTPQMSVNKLSAKTIKKTPVVLGEVDILKIIQLLPGVTNSGEGASGFNVRGGAADQNLVLLDEAPLYNTSHLFGFFSVFNADAIKDIKLYKGGIPAQYGGRVSSILDARQKDGNNKEFHFNGGVGLISSRLLIEGPTVKEKGSFLLAGRTSYANLFLKLANIESRVGFYDINAKISHQLNANNRLYLSGYFGNDNFEIANLLTNDYGNNTFNLRWNHLFSDKLFSNLSFIYSKYDYELGFDFLDFDWLSSIQNTNLKYDLSYYYNDKLKFKFGFNGLFYNFNPGEITPTTSESSINADQLDKKRAFEPAGYLSINHKVTPKLFLEYGLRYSLFYRLGGQPLNIYQDDLPVTYNPITEVYSSATAIGTENFDKNDVIASFDGLEPRFAASYQLNDNTSFKASYQRMNQYIHLISNTNSPTPLDVWAPSGKYIDPQISDQFALGFFKNLADNTFSLETEVYFKSTDNRIDYIDGADLIANNEIETDILIGEMRAYGIELLLKKIQENLPDGLHIP